MKIFKYLSTTFRLLHQFAIVLFAIVAIFYVFALFFDVNPTYGLSLENGELVEIGENTIDNASKLQESLILRSDLAINYKNIPSINFKKFSTLTLTQKLLLGILTIFILLDILIFLKILKLAEVFFHRVYNQEIFSNAQVSKLKFVAKLTVFLWFTDYFCGIVLSVLVKLMIKDSSKYTFKPDYFGDVVSDTFFYALVAGIFYAFAKIFEYGMELQQDHDLNI